MNRPFFNGWWTSCDIFLNKRLTKFVWGFRDTNENTFERLNIIFDPDIMSWDPNKIPFNYWLDMTSNFSCSRTISLFLDRFRNTVLQSRQSLTSVSISLMSPGVRLGPAIWDSIHDFLSDFYWHFRFPVLRYSTSNFHCLILTLESWPLKITWEN